MLNRLHYLEKVKKQFTICNIDKTGIFLKSLFHTSRSVAVELSRLVRNTTMSNKYHIYFLNFYYFRLLFLIYRLAPDR